MDSAVTSCYEQKPLGVFNFPSSKIFKLIHVGYDRYYPLMCWGLLSNRSIRVIRCNQSFWSYSDDKTDEEVVSHLLWSQAYLHG